MTIASVTGAGSYGQAGPAITSPLLHGAMSTIAQRLGVEPTTLEAALCRGASVDELAARRGIASADLAGAVAAEITAGRAAAGQPAIEPETLTRMVTRALAQGRRAPAAHAQATQPARDPLSLYGSSARLVDDAPVAAVSVLA